MLGFTSNYITNTFNATEIKLLRSFIEMYKNMNFFVSRSNTLKDLLTNAEKYKEKVFSDAHKFEKDNGLLKNINPELQDVLESIVETEYKLLDGIEKCVKPDTKTPSLSDDLLFFKNKINNIFDEALTYKIKPYEHKILNNFIIELKLINMEICDSRSFDEVLYLSKRACLDVRLLHHNIELNYQNYVCKKEKFIYILKYIKDIEIKILINLRNDTCKNPLS